MKLLHTADLHMDRSFEGLTGIPTALAKRLREANQQLLMNIVTVAIREAVDLVIFAGDTFHQSQTSISMQAQLMAALEQLKQAEIPVILTFGNHDYYKKDRYWFSFPDNVFLFEKEMVETLYFETKAGEQVAVSGFSYEHPWIDENKALEFPIKQAESDIHIGIYHGDTSRKAQQNYAPFTWKDLKATGYNYWALGHIHQPQIVSEQPLIVYPGTPQGHTKKEQSLQGVAVVTLSQNQATVQFEKVAEIDWTNEEISLAQCRDTQSVLSYLETSLLTKWHAHQQQQLMALTLKETQHLDVTVVQAIVNGELLSYLQQQLLQKTQGDFFVYRLILQAEEPTKEPIYLAASPNLLTALEKTYLDPVIFEDTTKELLRYAEFAGIFSMDEQWRLESLGLAHEQINEDFTIQEDPL
ncbi:metallophosphoesterase family protein [Enterococcus faecalis]|uniref:metallophosphoesterase n=1 Tax=Enterococcus faecalis TaxID=1351 RepID=UPI001573E63A|nr:metallophosphoesterase [Enterococcus faecalis]EGO2791473.1 DNA repair exonuclease [Enterococcus faecalis]EGO8241257.1 DNA repair exonuclease [Enterococcus faecalis]EGO8814207.1 DNA repair exonuclease [Enterococcus faecalis]EHD7926967.1 DNA repair exonuclease [Enterococcus faecalis]EJE4058100.1 metallophosphoesterase family protein [Enterococcus faecalis]